MRILNCTYRILFAHAYVRACVRNTHTEFRVMDDYDNLMRASMSFLH